MKRLAAAAAAALSLLASAPAMAAVTYNAASEFNAVQGGSTGVWSYGMISGGTFSPLTFIGGSNVFGRPGAAFDTPLVGAPGAGNLLMHPGEFGEKIVLRFTAPTAGAYTANFSAFLGDSSCGGCGGTDGVVADLNGVSDILDRPTGYAPHALAWTGHRNAGETIDFSLDGRSNYGWDSTQVAGAITAGVPEPATWAMMLMGVAGAGAALRTQRRRPALAVA
jgi:hypothetical protein